MYGAVGAGCRLWGLLPSWFRKDWGEAAEVAMTGRWFQSLIVWGKNFWGQYDQTSQFSRTRLLSSVGPDFSVQ